MAEASVIFAESASEAWTPPVTALATARAAARGAILTATASVFRGPSRFLRCLYAHAVFPEHRLKFRAVIRGLKNNGEFVTTETVRDMVRHGRQPDGRYYHLSFDDGFANVFEAGCEVLVAERVPATIFVVPAFVNASPGELEAYFHRLPAYRQPIRVMTWAQVRQAVDAGIEIGSHTLSHARLAEISSDAACLRAEVGGSRVAIEAATGVPCRAFAWPYGTMQDIDEAGFAAIEQAGYEIAFSAVRGRVDGYTGLFRVPRHQLEFHWPESHIRLWARGFRE